MVSDPEAFGWHEFFVFIKPIAGQWFRKKGICLKACIRNMEMYRTAMKDQGNIIRYVFQASIKRNSEKLLFICDFAAVMIVGARSHNKVELLSIMICISIIHIIVSGIGHLSTVAVSDS